MDQTTMRFFLGQIEKKKEAIAKERDELRKLVDTVEDYLDSFDRGVAGLESGFRELTDAVDAISEVV